MHAAVTQKLEGVRERVAQKWPALAPHLSTEALAKIDHILRVRENNRRVDLDRDALIRRLRARYGYTWNALSVNNDALQRVEERFETLDYRDFELDAPMEPLLDLHMLDLAEHNIMAEQRFRLALWDRFRATRVRVVVRQDAQDLQLAIYAPGQGQDAWWPVGHAGGKVTFDELLAIPSVAHDYDAKVRHGPEYQYLRQYYGALDAAIDDWENKTQFLDENVLDQDFVAVVSFLVRFRLDECWPFTDIFIPARNANMEAWDALCEGRLEMSALALEKAEGFLHDAATRVQDYDEEMTKGVLRALKILIVAKEAGKVAGAILTGRGPLAAAQVGRAAIHSGLSAGGMSLMEEVAQQGSAIGAGIQDSPDVSGALIRFGKDALVTGVATWTGVQFTRLAARWLRPAFLRWPMPELVRQFTPELLGGIAASPVTTIIRSHRNLATGEGEVPHGIGGLSSAILDDITSSAILQMGLSPVPVLGRLEGGNVHLFVPEGDGCSAAGLDVGIVVQKDQYPHDRGPAFHTMPERNGADQYARVRAAQCEQAPAVAEVSVRLDQLGKIVDVRLGGAHRAAWESFLASPAYQNKEFTLSWGEVLRMPGGVESRRLAFETFLRQGGLADADVVFGPVGDPCTGGITRGATTQVAIRSNTVAVYLDAMGFRWAVPRPGGP
jgi:hypothetical protein